MVGGQRHGSAALLTGKGPGILVRLHVREILNIYLRRGTQKKPEFCNKKLCIYF